MCYVFVKSRLLQMYLNSIIQWIKLFGYSVRSNPLWPHGLHTTRLPCPSLSPAFCSNSCPLSHWCYPTISSSVSPFSFCPQSCQASGSFPMSQLFASGGQTIGVSALASASVLLMTIQGWFPLGLTSLISDLQFDLLAVQGTLKNFPSPEIPTNLP